jgi:hypothetical protein
MQPVISHGTEFKTGLRAPDPKRMRAAPQYQAAYTLIPQSEWPTKGGGLRNYMKWRENQGQYGSCGGHGSSAALTAAINYQRARSGKDPLHLSPTFLYGLCNGGSDNGSAPDDLRQAILDSGCCLISTVPEGAIYSRRYPSDSYTEAKRFKGDQLLVLSTFEEMVTANLREEALFSGIFCGGNFNPSRLGVMPEFDGREVGGHCTAQIGELEKINGVWGLWTLNSWGASWGVDGWCWLPRSYFDGGLPSFGAVAIVSVMPDPMDSETPPAPVAA